MIDLKKLKSIAPEFNYRVTGAWGMPTVVIDNGADEVQMRVDSDHIEEHVVRFARYYLIPELKG